MVLRELVLFSLYSFQPRIIFRKYFMDGESMQEKIRRHFSKMHRRCRERSLSSNPTNFRVKLTGHHMRELKWDQMTPKVLVSGVIGAVFSITQTSPFFRTRKYKIATFARC